MPTNASVLEARAAARRAAFKAREARRAERMEQLKAERLAQMTTADASDPSVQKVQIHPMDVDTLYNHIANRSGIIVFDTRHRKLFDERHIVGSLWLDRTPFQTMLQERQEVLAAVKSGAPRTECETLVSPVKTFAEDPASLQRAIQAIPSAVRHRFLNRSHRDGPVVVVCGGGELPQTKGAEQSVKDHIAAEALNAMLKLRACYVLTVPVAEVAQKMPLLVVPTLNNPPSQQFQTSSQCTCHVFPSLVIAGLYLGSAETASDRQVFEMLGIGRVINVTENVPNYFEDACADGVQYLNIAITDAPDAAESLSRALQGAIDFMAETFAEPAASSPDPRPPPPSETGSSGKLPVSTVVCSGKQKAILVHCEFGVSRSASVVIAYLMQKKSWSFEQSYNFLRTRRPKVKPNLGFRDVLQRMHKKILSESGSSERL